MNREQLASHRARVREHRSFQVLVMVGAVLALVIVLTWTHRWGSSPYANYRFFTTKAEIAARGVLTFIKENGSSLPALASALLSGESYERNTGPAGSIPVLVYHGITKDADMTDRFDVTRERFKEHMFALKEAGYDTVSLDDLEAYMRGERSLPEKSFVLTFDDGRRDTFYGADPILRALGYEASLYVITKYVDGTYGGGHYLSHDEVALLAHDTVWNVGAHSRDGHEGYRINEEGDTGHFYTNRFWIPEEGRFETLSEYSGRVYADLSRAKDDLHTIGFSDVRSFAFPFGDFRQDIESPEDEVIARALVSHVEEEYDLVLYQYRPGEYYSHVYPLPEEKRSQKALFIKRINIARNTGAHTLLQQIEKGAAKQIPYVDSLDTDLGWIHVWGGIRVASGMLTLAAEKGGTGASSILDGTGGWQDLHLEADVESPSGAGFFVWVRFLNDDNYAGCNFGEDGFVHAEEVVDGEKRVIRGARGIDAIREGLFTVGVHMEGRTITCSIDGEPIVTTEFVDPSLSQGGIGFRTWNRVPDTAMLHVHEVRVASVETRVESE